ncbi:ABC transporter permease [Streptomyces albireticuli]|uniref:ABC transporter permease n=1 Tax=Streptomyces albireticuli TaxID=1940 RepID=A0A1Z2LAQ1_9ACTN|nr:ABC transporter permease [Streptomyces albireticuli]ARZ71399.1 ABC transporter permease [Streptomyces albireticuli]
MSFTAVLRSEWTKFRSVRSSVLALASAFVATAGVSVLVCALQRDSDDPAFEPLFASFFGISFGQIAAVCFGALMVAGEYGRGAIGVSLTAVPRRGLLYGAKLALVTGLVLAAGLFAGVCAFFAGQGVLGDRGVGPGAAGAPRAVFGCGLHLALLAALSAGAAAVLRSTVGTIGLLVPAVCFLSPVLGGDSGSAVGGMAQFLPDRAGQQILHAAPEGLLGAWTGLGVTALWAAAAAGAGWWAMCRRDA